MRAPSFLRSLVGALVLAVVAGVSACRPPVPEQVLRSPAPTPAKPPLGAHAEWWTPRANDDSITFVIDATSVLHVFQDTVARTDSISAHTEVLWRGVTAGRFSGRVAVFATRMGNTTALFSSGALPVTFSGDARTPASVRLASPAPSCMAPAPAATVAAAIYSTRDLWFRLPDTLRIGTVWQDTATMVQCRDGIPLRLNSVRSYRVTQTESVAAAVVLVITRDQHLTLTGRGDQWGEEVAADGAGNSQMTFRVSAATGAVITAEGTGVLELRFGGTRRMQRVRQMTVTRIHRTLK